MINLVQTKKILKRKIKKSNCNASIAHPFELLRMKRIDYLEVKLSTESYCIRNMDGKWKVYFLERGKAFNERIFDTEQEACEFFYNWVKSGLKI